MTDPFDAWMDALAALTGRGRSSLEWVGAVDLPDGTAAAALTAAHEHGVVILEQTRTMLRVSRDGGHDPDDALVVVVETPRHHLNVGIARTLLAWDTLVRTRAFPPGYGGGHGTVHDAGAAVRLLNASRADASDLTAWAQAAELDHPHTRDTVDTAMAHEARWHTVPGRFGDPVASMGETEELLARLITDATGNDPVDAYRGPGTHGQPDITPAVLDHVDLVRVVQAERRLTLRAGQAARDSARSL